MRVREYQRRAATAGLNATRFLGVAAFCAVWTYIIGRLLGVGL